MRWVINKGSRTSVLLWVKHPEHHTLCIMEMLLVQSHPPIGRPRVRIQLVLMFSLITLLFLQAPAFVWATSGGWTLIGYEMRMLKGSIELYETNTGIRLDPATDPMWFEKLILNNYVSEDSCRRVGGPPLVPLDGYETPYYVAWTDDGELIVASLGANCQNDFGDLDDWISGQPPNFGYWYKEYWPLAVRYLIIGLVLVLGGVVFQIPFMRGLHGIPCILICLSVVVIVVCNVADFDELHGRNGPSHWFQRGVAYSILMILLCILWYPMRFGMLGVQRFVINRRRDIRSARRMKQCCPECGYNLLHQRQPGCPECGYERATLAHK